MIRSPSGKEVVNLANELRRFVERQGITADEIYRKIKDLSTRVLLENLLAVKRISKPGTVKDYTVKDYIEEKVSALPRGGALLIDRINILIAAEKSRQPISGSASIGSGVASSSVPLYFSRRIYLPPVTTSSSTAQTFPRSGSAAASSSSLPDSLPSQTSEQLTNQDAYLKFSGKVEEGKEHPLFQWISDSTVADLADLEFNQLTDAIKTNERSHASGPILKLLFDLLDKDNDQVISVLNHSEKPFPLRGKAIPVVSSSRSSSSSDYSSVKTSDMDNLIQAANAADKNNLRIYLEGIKFLIDNRSNINVIDDKFESVTLKALRKILQATNDQEKQLAFAIFSNLLIHRKPVDEMILYRTLHFCSENYRRGSLSHDDYIYNCAVLDIAISRLFGIKFSLMDVFNEGGKNYYKYIAHIAEMKGEVLDKESNEKIKLDGYITKDFVIIHLRFFLQFLIESVDLRHDHQLFYQEFLHEAEMCWLNLLTHEWRYSRLSRDDGDTKIFSQILGKYVLRQINGLKDNHEYSLQLGWQGHSICNVFRREGNEIHPRIDNGGSGAELHPIKREPIAASSTASTSDRIIDNGGSGAELHPIKREPIAASSTASTSDRIYVSSAEFTPFSTTPPTLEQYLANLFEYKIGYTWGKTAEKKKEVKRNIYHRFPTPRKTTPNPDFRPVQRMGNCVAASFTLGVIKRIGDENAWSIQGKECDILIVINKIRNNESDFAVKLESETTQLLNQPASTFQTDLCSKLSVYYNPGAEDRNSPFQQSYHVMRGFSTVFSTVQSLSSKQSVSAIDYLLNESRTEFRIRLIGSAGSGKTTLSRFFAKDYARQLGLNHPIFYLSFRNLSNQRRYPPREQGYSLIDVIDKEIMSKAKGRSLYLHERHLLNESLKKDSLFVLDGLDELIQLPHLQQALDELLVQKKIVVTSRPHIENQSFQLDFDTELSLEPYPEEEVQHFIEEAFHRTDVDPSDALARRDQLLAALAANPKLRELCGIPMTLSQLCQCVVNGNMKVLESNNLAGIYSVFVDAMFDKALNRRNRSISQRSLISREEIRQTKQALNFTGFLAFKILENSKRLVCDLDLLENALSEFGIVESEAREKLKRNLSELGVFKSDGFGGEFIHASFQEYLAVRYLIKCLGKSKNTSAYACAIRFINTQRHDLKYQHVFSLFFHQVAFQKQLVRTRDDIVNIDRLCKRFLTSFIFDESNPISSEILLQTIELFLSESELLEDYFSRMESDRVLYHRFIDRLLDHVLSLFACGISDSTQVNAIGGLIPRARALRVDYTTLLKLSSVDSDAIEALAKFFNGKPDLKARHQVISRIHSVLRQHPCVSNPDVIVTAGSSAQSSESSSFSGSSLPTFNIEFDLMKEIDRTIRIDQVISEKDSIWPQVANFPVAKNRHRLIPYLHKIFAQKFYNALSNGIKFIQKLDGFDNETIRCLLEGVIDKIDFNSSRNYIGSSKLFEKTGDYREDFRLAILELVTNRLEILSNTVLDEHLVDEMTDLCQLLKGMIMTSVKDNALKDNFLFQIMRKVIWMLPLLNQSKHRSERMNELFDYFLRSLEKYLDYIFNNRIIDDLAQLWCELVDLQKVIPRLGEKLFDQDRLRKLQEEGEQVFENANNGTNASGSGYLRTSSFERLCFVVGLIPAIDIVGVTFGDKLIEDLVEIARWGETKGYARTSRYRVRDEIKQQAWEALCSYDCVFTADNHQRHINRLKKIIEFMNDGFSLGRPYSLEIFQMGERMIKRLEDYKRSVVRPEIVAKIDDDISKIKRALHEGRKFF